MPKARQADLFQSAAAPLALCEPATLALVNDTDLAAILAAVSRAVASRVLKRNCLSSWSAVVDYLTSQIGFEQRENFRVLFLDKRNGLIADETMGVGTVDHVPVYPREVARRALELNACALILSHNHPSGDPTPSSADIQMTKEIMAALKPFGIVVHDHIIVGRAGDHTSLKSKQLM